MSRDPLAVALRLLAARERSSGELAARLRQKGCDEGQIEATIARCRGLGYLDDERFARQRTRTLRRQGRAVGRRLLNDLLAHAVPAGLAHTAIAEAEAERPEREILADLLQQRFAGFDFATADDRQRRRVIDFFRRRGFSPALILDILHGREVD